MIRTNSVIVAVLAVIILTVARVNVVVALVTAALIGGVTGGMPLREALAVFSAGRDDGAKIALNQTILAALAAAVAHSGRLLAIP
jgi:predicted histidine transporter YuiF (NhaC family)